MSNIKMTIAGLCLLLLVACSGSAPESRKEAAAADAEAKALGRDTDKTVFDDMIQTEDRARAVEGVTLGHKDALDAAMQEAEGGTPPPSE